MSAQTPETMLLSDLTDVLTFTRWSNNDFTLWS